MSQLKNLLDVYKILLKSNCGQCLVPTCMAFAAAVQRGEKQLTDCPYIAGSNSEPFTSKIAAHKTISQNREEAVEKMKSKMFTVTLPRGKPRGILSAAQKSCAGPCSS
jgi:CO dehydrogenase/acetyl-CoA synthase gamma subunit (corrinoid Fe-S protein)